MSQEIPIRNLPRSLQELPPHLARLCLQAEKFMRGDIAPAILSSCGPGQRHPSLSPCNSGQTAPAAFENRGILVACSGGCDSTALLLILHCLAPRLGCRLAVAHLDHQLRPESAQEAEYVRAICAALELPFFHAAQNIAVLSAERGTGIEETARHARYAFLESARRESGCDYLATAHHLNDLAEDILMRLLRGTGWPALGGMDAFCSARRLIRPLLVTKRNKLENFLSALSIPWCEDASNTDPAYLRNRIRSTLLPLFLQENPAFLHAMEGLWRLARTDSDHWSVQVDNILFSQAVMKNHRLCLTDVSAKSTHPASSPVVLTEKKENMPCANVSPPHPDTLPQCPSGNAPSPIVLSKSDLECASKALRLRLYKRCVERLGPGQPLLENLLRLDTVWQRNQGGSTVQFPGGKTATITSGNILFSRS